MGPGEKAVHAPCLGATLVLSLQGAGQGGGASVHPSLVNGGNREEEPMKRLMGVPIGACLFVALMGMPSGGNVNADGDDHDGGGQSDHALLDASVPEHVYCGVGRHIEPWTLHVSASPSGGSGTLTIQFRDASAITFNIPAGDSFSLTQSMGGVPGVDDLVRIDLSSGGAMVSARARRGARDPFIEPVPEKDNFCINIPAEQTAGTVGVTLGGTLPAAWDGGTGKLN